MVAGKRILWYDPNAHERDKFYAAELQALMKDVSSQATSYKDTNDCRKLVLKTLKTCEETIKEINKDDQVPYDLVITSYGKYGMDALKILHEVKKLQNKEIETEIKEATDGNPIADRVVQCPLVLVHDSDGYESSTSEKSKGQVIRLGACEYTTDSNSLIQALIRIFSVSENGRDRNEFRSIPGTASSSKKRVREESESTEDDDKINIKLEEKFARHA